MGSLVKRWGWLVVFSVLAIGIVSWRLAGWEEGTARRQAAEAAGIPVERVDLRGGLNVHLSGFTTEAERDAAVSRVAALDSSWAVTADLVGVPGPGVEVASGPATTQGVAVVPSPGPAAPSASVSSTVALPTTVPSTTASSATVPSSTVPATTSTTGPAATPSTVAGPGPSGPELAARLGAVGPIGFDPGDTAPRPADQAVLDRAAALIKADASGRVVRVVGHTDTEGARADNQRLSLLRARSVVAYLVKAGVAPARLEAVGAGEDGLLANPELTAADKERNRRIEWVVGS